MHWVAKLRIANLSIIASLRFKVILQYRHLTQEVSSCRNMVVGGNAGKGRPKKRLGEVFEDDLNKCGLDRDLAKDRDGWKAQIMGKTSDLCEHGQREVK